MKISQSVIDAIAKAAVDRLLSLYTILDPNDVAEAVAEQLTKNENITSLVKKPETTYCCDCQNIVWHLDEDRSRCSANPNRDFVTSEIKPLFCADRNDGYCKYFKPKYKQ